MGIQNDIDNATTPYSIPEPPLGTIIDPDINNTASTYNLADQARGTGLTALSPLTSGFQTTAYGSPEQLATMRGLGSFEPAATGGAQPLADLQARQLETYAPHLAGLTQEETPGDSTGDVGYVPEYPTDGVVGNSEVVGTASNFDSMNINNNLTGGFTQAEYEQMIADYIANNPTAAPPAAGYTGMTQEQIQAMINASAGGGQPQGMTQEQIQAMIDSNQSPYQGMTPEEISALVSQQIASSGLGSFDPSQFMAAGSFDPSQFMAAGSFDPSKYVRLDQYSDFDPSKYITHDQFTQGIAGLQQPNPSVGGAAVGQQGMPFLSGNRNTQFF